MIPFTMTTPEALARQNIDRQLAACGWIVQDRDQLNLWAGRGVAVREFPLQTGFADYLLFVDRQAVGVVEAKREGVTLSVVADQAARYSVGLPKDIPHITLPLPFLYESTGQETYFRDERDPNPRSRRVFTFHRPETLAEWATAGSTLRARLAALPAAHPLNENGMWQLTGPCGEKLLLDKATDSGPFEIGLLGTRTTKKVAAKTRRFSQLLAGLQRPIFLLDVRRAGVGGQGSWSPLELATIVPAELSEAYSFFHLPSLAPSVVLLQAYRKSRKLPALSEADIVATVSKVRQGIDPGDAAWKHWQVFREKYRIEIEAEKHSLLTAAAFIEAAQAAGGLAIFMCAEQFRQDFDSLSQSQQDDVYCHRYTLAAAACRLLQQRHPGCSVTRIDLSLEVSEPHSREYPAMGIKDD